MRRQTMKQRPPRRNGSTGAWAMVATAVLALAMGPAVAQAEPALALKACRLKGLSTEARCGVLQRPLDPARPQGVQIDLHVAVLPALARNKLPDPVFFFAGGPGQSAIALAGPVSGLMGRFLNRRDVVLIDQRGTGQSAPLQCDDSPSALRPLREQIEPTRETARLKACLARLQKLPYGDLRYFTTTLAMADAEAVRQALGLGPVNVIGGSYGTRAVLEYLRAYPASVRRAVIDGVAPPDMVLMRATSTDNQAALDGVLDDCEQSPVCSKAYPRLRQRWQALLASLPREVVAVHPLTGANETLTLSRDAVLGLVRTPLYVPVYASALPYAISEAANGRFTPLVGVGAGLASGAKGMELAAGMHFSVVCAEDFPRLSAATDAPGRDLGSASENVYRELCAAWPRGEVPAAFYSVPASASPVLVLSGSSDPVTPPRHGERVARLLGPQALHLVVPHAGHGVMGQGCMADLMYRFVDQPDPVLALKTAREEASCAAKVPRPEAYLPMGLAAERRAAP
jgi:pimeloyl-ACP methyl ester carboxylesterase